MNDFHFCISSQAASSRVRATQMAGALGKSSVGPGIAKATTTVFVKKFPSPDQLDEARRQSSFVVFDPIDNYDFAAMTPSLCPPIDGVIASNAAHCGYLKKIFPRSLVGIIPHHHCVMPSCGIVKPAQGNRVGYIGNPDNLGISTERLLKAFPDALITEDLRAYEEIAIGIAYRPAGLPRTYKSNIKLANYWAYGIAAVCSPDTSYLEMMEKLPEHGKLHREFIAFDEDQAIRELGLLARFPDLRATLVSSFAHAASEYDIGKVVDGYRSFASLLRQRRVLS